MSENRWSDDGELFGVGPIGAPDEAGEFRRHLLETLRQAEGNSRYVGDLCREAFKEPANKNYSRAYAALKRMAKLGLVEKVEGTTEYRALAWDVPESMDRETLERWLET